MNKAHIDQPTWWRLWAFLKALFTANSGEMVSLLAQMVRALRAALIDQRYGTYEVIRYDATVELLDAKGQAVVVTRLEEVRFLRDHTVAFYDTVWGNGNLFAEYACSPGVPVDHFTDGSRQRVLISLRETRNHGDVLLFRIRRKIEGGFTESEEWWETETVHPTRWLRVRIVFPKERPCQWATVTAKSQDRSWPLDVGRMRLLTDGRQELSWEMAHPAWHEVYVLKWCW